jgi:tetratricopeptide (TPR) repeat protein
VNIPGKFYLIVLFCFISGLSRLSPAAEIPVTPHDLLPEQNIEVVGEDLPQWKTVWDKARKKALQGNFEEALHFYQALLIMKSNLEEARWEMVRLLMHLKRWDEAAESLENLTGSYPENILYTRALGKVMWEMGQYERSVILFKKIYAEKPTDQLALAGLVEGLMRLDRKIEALPYLEQLSRQEPTNRGVRSYLATVYFDEGDYEKARPHLTILARSEEAESDILYMTAKTYEHLGLNQQASIYWERYVAREPENSAAHQFLAKYYDQTGQLSRSIQHLKALLTHNPEDTGLLARLGRTYEKAGDYGNALYYYKEFLKHLPNDAGVQQTVTQLAAATKTKKQLSKPEDQYSSSDRATIYADLKKNILGLDSAVRYRKAGPLYKQLIEIVPRDQEI